MALMHCHTDAVVPHKCLDTLLSPDEEGMDYRVTCVIKVKLPWLHFNLVCFYNNDIYSCNFSSKNKTSNYLYN